MKILIDVPEYSAQRGIQLSWDDNFVIDVNIRHQAAYVNANKPGLVSLARLLLTLAQDDVLGGSHVHLDESNSLEPGSNEIVIAKTPVGTVSDP